MFKKILFLLFIYSIFFLGCVNKKEIENLKAEKQALSVENEKLKLEIQELNKKIKESETSNQKLKTDLIDTELASEVEKAYAENLYKELTETLKPEIESGQIQVKRLYKALVINISENVFFASGQAYLKKKGETVLYKIAPILKKAMKDKVIQVVGHTDNVVIGDKIKNKFKNNWELGAIRATTVVDFLITKAKIEPQNLSALTFGEYKPIASNDSIEGRAKNRRIEIMVLDARIYGLSQQK